MSDWQTILVGVDGSEGSRKALRWAAEEAERHDVELQALTVYSPLVAPATPAGGVSRAELPDAEGVATEALLGAITTELGAEPPVRVQPRVRQGHAADELIKLSSDVDLLVVGTRGHGGFAGLLLGSVSQHVAAHANCTVVVVR